ncbi:hypothetical protein BDN71DRAFT_1395574 [Pleurotus eryngii]|uniref:Uncharacterized protein n=1 Tax=Pleurotus eryngii TaxID=5323 RepID=A0A9P6D570_PLEER|nr:hypothetical protein BDN71DRAFT_1395574 [Pleurotus eryngii]
MTANEQLSENFIQDSFHSYLKSSLTQAKLEKLLDADVLSSAEGDLMITGPALCLYFAALRCTTNPPSVPLPRSKTSPHMDLSPSNCPPAFVGFLRVWSNVVQPIQSLVPEQQHDLARIICGLEPISQQVNPSINGIAADLRAVAIEISQRRSFQNRYASDLQAALDSGAGQSDPRSRKASFVPPPSYEAASPPPSPRRFASSTSSTPSILTPDTPAIELIRETLYAALGDVLESHSSVRTLLKRDPPRAYFASVGFAILYTAENAITPDGQGIRGVLGNTLTLDECPTELRPFMTELLGIGSQAKGITEEDDTEAMKLVGEGKEVPLPRLERARKMLEEGVGWSSERSANDEGRRSVEGRAVAFVNRINGLALGMTRLRAFRERQDDVFKVLAGITS